MRTLRAHPLTGILLTLSTVLIMAGAAVAGARGVFFLSPDDGGDAAVVDTQEPEDCPVEGAEEEPAEPADDPTDPEEGEDPTEPEEGSEDTGSGEDCDATEGSEEEAHEEGEEGEEGEEEDSSDPAAATLGEREDECLSAAGLEEHPLPDGERLTGLDNAISRVLENCTKNPQAPGLVVALERLAENRANKDAREQAKAERREEREARKAAKAAARGDNGRGHGGSPPGLEKGSSGKPAHAGGGAPAGNGKANGRAKGKAKAPGR